MHWVEIIDILFIPKNEVDGSIKLPKDCSDDETKKASYDLKENILISVLSSKVYYFIPDNKSSQVMWNTFQVFYKGTGDAEDFKINTLEERYEIFRIEPGETMESIQTRFLYLISKLDNFGKSFFKEDCANKILRYMCREWKPKVTTTKESNDLNNLDITKLFGKLSKHENKVKHSLQEK